MFCTLPSCVWLIILLVLCQLYPIPFLIFTHHFNTTIRNSNTDISLISFILLFIWCRRLLQSVGERVQTPNPAVRYSEMSFLQFWAASVSRPFGPGARLLYLWQENIFVFCSQNKRSPMQHLLASAKLDGRFRAFILLAQCARWTRCRDGADVWRCKRPRFKCSWIRPLVWCYGVVLFLVRFVRVVLQ